MTTKSKIIEIVGTGRLRQVLERGYLTSSDMTIAEKFTEMSRNISYPTQDPQKIAEIEDMKGKEKREEILQRYKEDLASERQAYREKQYELIRQFKLALFKEYGVENHPKAEKVFSMAWDRGHSSGFNDVELEFSELVELIRD